MKSAPVLELNLHIGETPHNRGSSMEFKNSIPVEGHSRPPQTCKRYSAVKHNMVALASVAAIAWVAVQWSLSVLVLLVLGALLTETSPGADPTAVANYSAGKRCEMM